MRKSLQAFAAVAVLVLVALPVAAQSVAYDFDTAAPADAGSAYYILTHPRALSKYLGLSSDQNTQFQALWKTLQTSVTTLRTARGPLCAQLRTDLGGTPNPATVGTDSINLFNNKEAIRAAHQTFDTAFSAILTPDQLTKYNALKEIAHLDNGPGTDILGECPPAS